MNSSRKCIALMRLCRTYASKKECGIKEVPHPNFKKLKELQKKFQCDDGVPSYLKGGTKDKLLVQATLVLTIIGLGWSAYTIIPMLFT